MFKLAYCRGETWWQSLKEVFRTLALSYGNMMLIYQEHYMNRKLMTKNVCNGWYYLVFPSKMFWNCSVENYYCFHLLFSFGLSIFVRVSPFREECFMVIDNSTRELQDVEGDGTALLDAFLWKQFSIMVILGFKNAIFLLSVHIYSFAGQ